MKKFVAALLLFSVPVLAAEDFKGEAPATEITVGALTGLAVINSSAGFALLGTASKKIINKGFIPQDINNQVFVEAVAGPTFHPLFNAFQYSLHLRWDFPKDDQWTFYALGGASGHVVSSSFRVFPRFAAGAFLKIYPNWMVRAELSHEMTVLGVSFAM